MTLAPTNNSSTLVGVPTFETEDALYSWMDSQVGDSYQRAKSAVNDWWLRTVTALMAADEYYGWDTLAGNTTGRGQELPERLNTWCNAHGLDTQTKRSKARNIAKAWLASNMEMDELLDAVGPDKLQIVGAGKPQLITAKLEASLAGATRDELRALNRELKADPSFVQDELKNAEERLAAAEQALNEYSGLRVRENPEYVTLLNAKAVAKRTFERVLPKTAATSAELDPAVQVATQEAIEAKKEALELKQEVEALRHQIELANKAKEDAEKEKRSALRDKKDITERFNDLHQQHQNPVDAKLILTGIHMRFIEMEKDANSYSIIEPGYQPRQYIKNCEACFVAMVEAWLPIIAEENFDAVVTAVEKLKRSAPEPLDYIDATVVTD